MKIFIKKFILFFILFCFCLVILELFVSKIPNNYSIKNDYITQRNDSIEILILGNSTTYYGLDPEYLTCGGYNLAQVSQTFDVDRLLFEKVLLTNSSIKVVIIPITPISFFEILGFSNEKWRTFNYNRYMDIKPLFSYSDFLENISTTISNDVTRFSDYYLKKKSQVNCSSSGFGLNYTTSLSEEELQLKAIKTAEKHLITDKSHINICKQELVAIIEIAQEQNIQVVLIFPPVYQSYMSNIDPEQIETTYGICRDIRLHYPSILLLDFTDDQDFLVGDFYDPNHLNNHGAKKLSLKIDSILCKTAD